MISQLSLDRRRQLKDGRFPVVIKVGFGTGLYIGTGITCQESEWSERTQLYSGTRARMVNNVLATRLNDTITRVLELRESGRLGTVTTAELRRILENPLEEDPETGKDFAQVAEEYISVRKLSASSVTSIRQTIRQVRGYADGPACLEQMDRGWLLGLEKHIGGKANSIAVHMRNIRTVFNYAIDEGYTKAYPFRKYKIRTEPTADRSLTAAELRTIFSYPCDPWMQEYIDIFKLTFLLCGINMVDLANLEKVTGGRLEYNRRKTGIHCSLAVQPEAAALIRKYRGKKKLLSILDRYASPNDYLSHLNDALKTIGTSWKNGGRRTGVALFPDVTSYWARYSWATIASDLDIPLDTIGSALGHSKGRGVTAIYVRTDMRKKVDEANRRVIDFVLYGKDWRKRKR